MDNLNFTAIDFETANGNRASVCSVGAVFLYGTAKLRILFIALSGRRRITTPSPAFTDLRETIPIPPQLSPKCGLKFLIGWGMLRL